MMYYLNFCLLHLTWHTINTYFRVYNGIICRTKRAIQWSRYLYFNVAETFPARLRISMITLSCRNCFRKVVNDTAEPVPARLEKFFIFMQGCEGCFHNLAQSPLGCATLPACAGLQYNIAIFIRDSVSISMSMLFVTLFSSNTLMNIATLPQPRTATLRKVKIGKIYTCATLMLE